MSVILDALKKAEEDRALATVPTLTSVHVERVEPRRRGLPWAMAAALLLSGGAGLWVWPVLPTRVGSLLPDFGRGAAGVSSVENRLQPRPPHSPQPVERSVSTPPPSGRAAVAEIPPAPLQTIAAPKPALAPVLASPKKASVRATRTAPRQAAPTDVQIPAQTPSATELGGATSVLTAPPALPVTATTEARVESASLPAVPKAAPQPEAAPSRLQEAIGRMTLNVLVYGDEPSDRKVYIGGRGYVEGDLVEGMFLVEEIRPEGVALSYQGQHGLLRKR